MGLLEKKECEGKKIIHVTTLLKQNESNCTLKHMLHTVITHASHCAVLELVDIAFIQSVAGVSQSQVAGLVGSITDSRGNHRVLIPVACRE